MSTSEEEKYILTTQDLIVLLLATIAFLFGFYQNIIGYQSLAGGIIPSSIVATIVLLFLIGASYKMHEALREGKNGTANLYLLFYMLPAFVAFSGNFNAFFTVSMQDEFLRRDLEGIYIQVGNLRSNIDSRWKANTAKVNQLKEQLEIQSRSGFGNLSLGVVKELETVLGHKMTPIVNSTEKQMLDGYQEQANKMLANHWYKNEIEQHLSNLAELQKKIKNTQQSFTRAEAYNTLEVAKKVYDNICSQVPTQLKASSKNDKDVMTCSLLVLSNPRSEQGKVYHAYKLAYQYPIEAFLPLFFSFLIDFAVPIMLYWFYKKNKPEEYTNPYGEGEPKRPF